MVTPNDQELATLGKTIGALVIALITLSYITVSLRLWVRYKITKSPGWDDAAMLMTLILYTCYCAFILTIVSRGAQQKILDTNFIHVTFVYVQLSEVFYILTTTTLKLSLGLFFLRVLTKRWQKRLFHIILAVSAGYGLFYVLISIFACGNPGNIADKLQGSNECLPSMLLLSTGLFYGVLNVIADWTFVLVPISVLVDSDLDRRAKISVSIVMALGAIGSVSSILRMVYLKGLLFGSNGLTISSIKATLWATAEPGTGMIAASIAILRPLVRNIHTSVHTRISNHSRKRSLPQQMNVTEDTIALNPPNCQKDSIQSVVSDDLWSPSAVVGQAQVQRVISIQMIDGRGSPAPTMRAPRNSLM